MTPPRFRVYCLLAAVIAFSALSGWRHVSIRPQDNRSSEAADPSPLQSSSTTFPAISPNPGDSTGLVTANLVQSAASADESNPVWAIPFGREFWQREKVHPAEAAPAKKPSSAGRIGAGSVAPHAVLSSVCLANAMERISHAFIRENHSARWGAQSPSYIASLEPDGVTFKPAPASGRAISGVSKSSTSTSDVDEFRFRTRSVRRGIVGQMATPTDPVAWHVIGNTAQALVAPSLGLVEHYTAVAAGIELTWILPSAVAGEGDLLIEALVSGSTSQEQTPSGIHFRGADGLARVKVGAATAVDQNGQSWPLTVRAEDDTLQIEVPAAVLLAAAYPLAIDPLISAEFGLDQPVEGPTPSTQSAPAAAAGESGFLVVWTRGKGEVTEAGVYAARFDAAGQLLDPDGLLLSSSAAEQTVCAVAANPGEYLVAWSAPHGTSTTDWDILGTRVRTDGTIVDSPALVFCGAPGVQTSPTVAANGEAYLVAWRDSRGTGVYGSLLRADGTLSATNGVSICSAANDQFTPSAAALGTNYLVVWQDYRSNKFSSDIYGARVSGAGLLLDTNGIAIGTRTNSQHRPTVAANGVHYLVVWEEYDLNGDDIYGSRVDAAGSVLDRDGLIIAHGANLQANAAVSANGKDFLVAWQDYRNSTTNQFAARIYAARVSSDGALEGEEVALSTSDADQATPALATKAERALVVWQDARNNPATALSDIFGRGLSAAADLALETEIPVTRPRNGQIPPAVAHSSTNFLVVWADNRNSSSGGLDIFGARLAQNGVLLDPAGFAICTISNRQAEPAVAASATRYLVVWSDWRNTPANASHADIYGTIIEATGAVPQSGGFGICTATNDQSLPSATVLGEGFLVAWQDARNSSATATRLDIYGARISGQAAVLDPAGIAICTNSGNQLAPALASIGRQALAVWTDTRNGAASDIYGVRVAEDGSLSAGPELEICRAANAQFAAAVAANGHDYLVVWADGRVGANDLDIYAATVDAIDSHPLNGFPIRIAPGQQSAPDVASQGSDYLVVWQEARGSWPGVFDVVGAWTDGRVVSGEGSSFLINTNSYDQIAPVASAGPAGPYLVAEQGWANSLPRIKANSLSLESIPKLDLAKITDHTVQLRLRGVSGLHYTIQASVDLSQWSVLSSVMLTNESVVITDGIQTKSSWRFYRAALLP